jgi:TolB protein
MGRSARWETGRLGESLRNDPAKGGDVTERYTLDLSKLTWRHESQRDKALPGGPVEAPLPLDPVNPQIVFQTQTYNPWTVSICAVKQDGSVFRSLTTNPLLVETAPAWSPGQSEIIFARGPDGASQLWVMNWNGAGQRQLTFPPAGKFDTEPAMSPDQRTIAFQRSYQIWLVNANGTNPRPLLNYSAPPQPAYVLDQHPTWSPDGALVAFNRQGGGQGVICTARATGAGTPAWDDIVAEVGDGSPLWPSWNPGPKIVYRSEADPNAANISWYDPLNSHTGVLTHPRIDQVDMWPSWSPDGTRVAFQRIGYSQDPDHSKFLSHIWVVNSDGTGEDDVTARRISQNAGTPNDASDWTPNWT